jgi:hypothetical protein
VLFNFLSASSLRLRSAPCLRSDPEHLITKQNVLLQARKKLSRVKNTAKATYMAIKPHSCDTYGLTGLEQLRKIA